MLRDWIESEKRKMIQGKTFTGNNWVVWGLFLFFSVPVIPQPGPAQLTRELHASVEGRSSQLAYIQTSKGFYETGEDLWFKTYLMDAQYLVPTVVDTTLYVQLFQEGSHQVVWQEKYEVQNGFADGHIYIQDTLPSGEYILAAYSPHSFYTGRGEFRAIRKIRVRKSIEPELELESEFDQSFYTDGESVNLEIMARSKDKERISRANLTAELFRQGESLGTVNTQTDRNGKADIHFPSRDVMSDLQVKLRIVHKDKETNLMLPVPYKNEGGIQFNMFPEGGHVVVGIENNLAFKAVNEAGEPADVSGTLYENEEPLKEFKSAHAGMGSFRFTPKPDKQYQIKLAQNDSIYSFPEIQETGLSLQLSKRERRQLSFTIAKNKNTRDEKVHLSLQIRGIMCAMFSGKAKTGELIVDIPTEEFPQGIAEVTLYNEVLEPVAERLVFINPDKKLNIEAELLKDIYSTREKAKLKIKVTDHNHNSVTANLSLSIFDKVYKNGEDPKNILTYTHLSSQLKGVLYDPTYYFIEGNDDREEALDLLMLTQGWRKYTWNKKNLEEAAKGDQVVFNQIRGTISSSKKRKADTSGQNIVMLFTSDKEDGYNRIIEASKTFKILPYDLRMADGGYLYLKPFGQAESSSKAETKITLKKPFKEIDQALKSKIISYSLPAKQGNQEKKSKNFSSPPGTIALDEVLLEGKKRNTFRDKYMGKLDSLAKFEGNNDYVAHGWLNCPVCSGEKPVEGETYTKYIGNRRITGHPFSFSAHEVKKIVYEYPKFTEEELLEKYNLSRLKGYYPDKEFYEPNYDRKSDDNLMPDYRNTLVWKPHIVTDEKGEATLEFFCSDLNSTFIIDIEGIDGNGLLGVKNMEFNVKR